mgnify:CR=1 FL=1
MGSGGKVTFKQELGPFKRNTDGINPWSSIEGARGKCSFVFSSCPLLSFWGLPLATSCQDKTRGQDSLGEQGSASQGAERKDTAASGVQAARRNEGVPSEEMGTDSLPGFCLRRRKRGGEFGGA